MASSSSSAASSQSPKKHDVFISFSGEDTRRNFTCHLHDALCRSHIQTYMDDRLQKGDEVWPELVKAIKDSMLFLVVFSEKYASSTWCLNELIEILECSKDGSNLVIPVFYNIEPTHIRKQTGSYQTVFAKHEQINPDQQLVQKWRNALTQAAKISGWDSSAYRNDAQLIRDIVNSVCKKLEPMHRSVSLDRLIGISEQIERVESLLCNGSQDIRFIGIWGMGGIGKTTIARALYEKLCFEFESSCFLPNIREQSEKENGITKLNEELISKLDDKESHIGMPHGQSTYVRKRLSRKKVLVILDDVDDAEQLNLAGDRCSFGQGSRIIVTTRDKQVLRNRNIDAIYQVRALQYGQALHLFNLKAFKNDGLVKRFEQLSWKVVNYAKGIPLILVELGFILCDKDKEDEWKSQLEKHEKGLSKKIQQILQISYDGLDHEEKHIFLDVACFFKGETAQKIKYLLDACGYKTSIGLERLQDKALLTISSKDVLMHELIQKMGWEVVRQECLENPGKRSRLWDPDDVYQVFKRNKGSEAIRGMSQDASKTKELNLSPRVFAKMDELKFLHIYNSNFEEHRLNVPQGTLEYLSDELRYLCWVKCPLKSLPTFFAENLVELDMQHSILEKLWDGVQNLEKLKIINLSDSIHLTELPDFSKASYLKIVNLSRCSSLHEVHPSILCLNKLEVLNLNGCRRLRCLPELPQSLGLLDATDCSSLQKVTVTSIAAEPLKANMKEANFRNCLELDDHSVKAILANVMIHINKSVSKFQNSSYKTEVIYPGSIVPEWFKYKTTDATSVTIDLSSAPRSKDWGLLFCVIVPHSISNEGICIEYEGCMRIINDQSVDKGNDDDKGDLNFTKMISDYWRNPRRDLKHLTLDHVCLWYDERFCLEIHEGLEKSRATSIPKFSLELNFHCDFLERRRWHRREIKKCGVCPTYVSEYQNFIKQMKLKSQASAYLSTLSNCNVEE